MSSALQLFQYSFHLVNSIDFIQMEVVRSTLRLGWFIFLMDPIVWSDSLES